MKLSTGRDALFTQLQTVTRAASTRSAIQALSGVQVLARAGGIELRATDMEIGLRVPLEGEVVREGAVVLPARLLVDVVRALPGDGRLAGAAPRRAGRGAQGRQRDLPHPDAAPGGLPAVPGGRGRRSRRRVPSAAFVETVAKVAALGVAGRDAPGAHRHPRLGARRRAADGRDGLLPPRRQGDEARGAAGGHGRGQRAGPRARRSSPASSAPRTARRWRCRCGPTRSCSRSAARCCPRG